MVKPGSQRQKEYLKRLKEKNREEYLEKKEEKKEGKADVVESHREAALQQENTKRPLERKKLQRAIRRQQVCMLFLALANVKGTLCGFQQSVLR